MKNKPKQTKIWTTPKLIKLSSTLIASGNSSDVRPGEFILYTPGTGCTRTTMDCASPSEIRSTVSTGQIISKGICYTDAQVNFLLVSFCS